MDDNNENKKTAARETCPRVLVKKLPREFRTRAEQEELDRAVDAFEDYRKSLDEIDAEKFMKEMADEIWPQKS